MTSCTDPCATDPCATGTLTHAVAVAAVTGAAGLAVALGPVAPAVAAPAPPQLSITVDDGRGSAGAGDRLDYAVTVTNLGGRAVRDLRVSQTVPTGSSLRSSAPDGRRRQDRVQWTVDVAPGKPVTLHTSLAVGQRLPADVLRLATVACAQLPSASTPLVCASDSNELPAGAALEVQQRELDAPTSALPSWWPYAAGGAGLAVLAGVAALLLRRRPRRTTTG